MALGVGEFLFFGTEDEGDLGGTRAIGLGALGRDTDVGFGTGALAVGVVFEEGVLGGETGFFFVKVGGLVAGVKEGLQEGDLAILIQIGLGQACDGGGEVLAKTGVEDFIGAFGGADEDAIFADERGEESGAGGGGVDEDEFLREGGEFLRQLAGAEVRATEVKLGFAAVEGAVADEDEPELAGGFGAGLLKGGGELGEVGGGVFRGGVLANDLQRETGFFTGLFPSGHLSLEEGGVFLCAGCTEGEQDLGVPWRKLGAESGGEAEQEDEEAGHGEAVFSVRFFSGRI